MESSYVSNASHMSNGALGYSHGSYQQHVQDEPSMRTFSSFASDTVLALPQYDISEQVRASLTQGPGSSIQSYETYLHHVDVLRGQLEQLEDVLRSGKSLMATAMKTLEHTFETLLKSSSISPDPEELKAAMLSDSAPDHIRPPEVLSGSAVDQLHSIARRLVENDHGETCSRLYRECRGVALQKNFDAMRVLRLSERQVQEMAWTDMEKNMQKWNEHMHIGMIFIAAEREACDSVLDELEPFREQCFVGLSKPCVMLLTGFGLAVAATKQSPEKLFALLDMYETALDLHQTVEELFAGHEGSSIRTEYGKLLHALGTAAKETFEKFEEAVKEQPIVDEAEEAPQVPASPSSGRGSPSGKANQQKLQNLKGGGKAFFGKLKSASQKRGVVKREEPVDDSKTEVASTAAGVACASGKVHPLASYVINYVIILCNGDLPYFGNLEHAVGESMGANAGSNSDTASVSTATGRGLTRVQAKIAFATKRILEALKQKLEARAAAMGDDVLAELFLMNNFMYILSKIEMSDAGRLLGVAWCGECAVVVDQHRDRYVANALAKFEPVFAEGALDNQQLIKRLKLFNATYEKLRQRQLSWSISNLEMREQVRSAVSKGLLERYSNFLTRAGNLLQQQKFMDVNIMSCKQVAEGLEGSFCVSSRGLRAQV